MHKTSLMVAAFALASAYAAFAGQYGFPLIRKDATVQAWRRRLPARYTENSFGGDIALSEVVFDIIGEISPILRS